MDDFLNLSNSKSLCHRFSKGAKVKSNTFSRFAKRKINAKLIYERDQESQPKTVSSDEIIGIELVVIVPDDSEISKGCQLQTNV